ncbi:MAG: glycosyltransferase family 2 protein, partial [Patescibacteria group bacterium]
EAQGDYLVLLNPDTWLSADFFTSLDDFWSKYPLAGVVGGQIRNQDGTIQPSVRRWPTPWSQMLVLLKLSRYSTKLLSNYLWIDFDYDQPAEVDQVMGACFICSKKNWQQFGGFDDNFFVWFEEVDFCRRLNEAGLTIRYEPSLKIGHSQAASFKQLDYVSRHVMFSRSLLYYARKHFGRGWYLPLRIAVVLGYIISYVGKIFIK